MPHWLKLQTLKCSVAKKFVREEINAENFTITHANLVSIHIFKFHKYVFKADQSHELFP